MKRIIAGIIVAATVCAPLISSAASAADLQAQAQALLDQVSALEKAVSGNGGAMPTQGAGGGSDSSMCPRIGRTLKRGSKGSDVTALQNFLAQDRTVYPEGTITGFYGQLTEAAVQRWQSKYNIVASGAPASTGYGVVGPRTAAAIAMVCSSMVSGGTPDVGGFIQITPVSGEAPLTVAIQATVNTVNSCKAAQYILDYGDGTALQQIPVSANTCQQQALTYTHVYSYPGTYQMTLSANGHQTSAVVTVSGSNGQSTTSGSNNAGSTYIPPSSTPTQSATISASVVSGTAPLSVTFTGTVTGPAGTSCSNCSNTLAFGDGATVAIPIPTDVYHSQTYTVTHTYTAGGSPMASISDAQGHALGSVGVTVAAAPTTDTGSTTSTTSTPTQSGTISASVVSGTAPLSVTFTGTVTGPSGTSCSNCSNTLAFGDGATVAIPIPTDVYHSQTYTVTHTYSAGGNPMASINDAQGNVLGSVGITVATAATASTASWAVVSHTTSFQGSNAVTNGVFYVPACTNYQLDWGDGTPISTQKSDCSGTGTVTLNATHTYTTTGSFYISLKDGTGNVKDQAAVSLQ